MSVGEIDSWMRTPTYVTISIWEAMDIRYSIASPLRTPKQPYKKTGRHREAIFAVLPYCTPMQDVSRRNRQLDANSYVRDNIYRTPWTFVIASPLRTPKQPCIKKTGYGTHDLSKPPDPVTDHLIYGTCQKSVLSSKTTQFWGQDWFLEGTMYQFLLAVFFTDTCRLLRMPANEMLSPPICSPSCRGTMKNMKWALGGGRT